MENTTNTTTTKTATAEIQPTTGIYTDTQAFDTISAIAEANPKAVSKDIDALLEMGEVDSETVWCGYLADIVADMLGNTYTENADLFDSAIVDFYCDQMEGMYDEDEEECDPITLVLVARFVEYTEDEIPLTSDLVADLQVAYSRLVADGYTMEDAVAEAVYIVADAQ